MEDVQRHLLGRFPIGGNAHDQRKHDAMSPFVQRIQRALIARRDGLDEGDPLGLRYESLPWLGIKDLAERTGESITVRNEVRRLHV